MASLEMHTVPGMPCPDCGYKIVVTLGQLLSSEAICCNHCGLRLKVDADRSRDALNDLRELETRIARASGGSRQ